MLAHESVPIDQDRDGECRAFCIVPGVGIGLVGLGCSRAIGKLQAIFMDEKKGGGGGKNGLDTARVEGLVVMHRTGMQGPISLPRP